LSTVQGVEADHCATVSESNLAADGVDVADIGAEAGTACIGLVGVHGQFAPMAEPAKVLFGEGPVSAYGRFAIGRVAIIVEEAGRTADDLAPAGVADGFDVARGGTAVRIGIVALVDIAVTVIVESVTSFGGRQVRSRDAHSASVYSAATHAINGGAIAARELARGA